MWIRQYKQTPGAALLDVGCGTGKHLAFLRYYKYTGEGLDLDANLLAVARGRYPDIPFHAGDMADFDLGHPVDIITCLFSAIGYVRTVERLHGTLRTLRRHLRPGGVLVLEPWLTPDTAAQGQFAPLFVETPALSVARLTVHTVESGGSVLTFHYLTGTPTGAHYFTERHELGLFTHAEYLAAFADAGLEVWHDPVGLIGRGMYIGRASLDSSAPLAGPEAEARR